MKSKSPTYLDIHSKNKRDHLLLKMQAVAEEIHTKFQGAIRVGSCPCCLAVELKPFVVKFGFAMEICEECGHIFTNPFPSLEALNYYYNSEFKDFENEFFAETFDNRVPIFERRLELIKALDVGVRLLDVGSAVGIFIEANERAGRAFDITACDISASACALLSARFPELQVVNADVSTLASEEYDVVTLWDTFEHVPNPDRVLTAVRRQLRPQGHFIFSTPNTRGFEWEVMWKDHVQLLPPGHVNLYNTKNISIVLQRNGFEVVDIKTMNPLLDLTYIKDALEKLGEPSDLGSRAARKLMELVLSERTWAAVESEMRSSLMAGNMVVIARAYE